jgi:hypothetical protein
VTSCRATGPAPSRCGGGAQRGAGGAGCGSGGRHSLGRWAGGSWEAGSADSKGTRKCCKCSRGRYKVGQAREMLLRGEKGEGSEPGPQDMGAVRRVAPSLSLRPVSHLPAHRDRPIVRRRPAGGPVEPHQHTTLSVRQAHPVRVIGGGEAADMPWRARIGQAGQGCIYAKVCLVSDFCAPPSPPRQHRLCPGRSGNPSSRPK